MSLVEILTSAQELDAVKTVNSKPELEIIIQAPNDRKGGITAAEFINVYLAISKEAKKQPIEMMVDKIHSNMRDAGGARFNNTRISNIYVPKENEPGYKRIKMIRIVKKRYPPFEGDGFKVVLSTEEVFEAANSAGESSQNDYARIKVRTAFVDWPKAPGWKIDMTAVWGMTWPTQINHLKKIIEGCFDSWKDISSVTEARLNKFNSFEIEAEYIGDYKKLDENAVLNVVSYINNIIQNKKFNENNSILYKEVAAVAKLISHYNIQPNMTVKKVSTAPIELNLNTWRQIYPPLGWYVTDKADGKRAILHLHQDRLVILSDTAKIINLPGGTFARTIVDSEEVDGTYYVFDVMYLKDSNVSQMAFQRRYDEIEPALEPFRKAAENLGNSFKIEAKPFNRFPLVVPENGRLDEEIRPTIEAMWNRTRPYEIDGLIFNSPDATYLNTKMYKWKPKNSIDFLAAKCPAQLLGPAPFLVKPGHVLYLLFVTISYDDYLNLGISIMDGYEKIFPQYTTKHSGKVHPLPSGGTKASFPIQFSPSFYPRAYLFYVAVGNPLNPASSRQTLPSDNDESVGNPLNPASSRQTLPSDSDESKEKEEKSNPEKEEKEPKETKGAKEHLSQAELAQKLLAFDTPQIVELYVDTEKNNIDEIIRAGKPLPWEIINIRDDRQTDVAAGGYFGNYIHIAESIAQNIINPFPLKSLWSTDSVYFEETKDPIYNPSTHFNSFVKSKLFTVLKPEHIHREHNAKAGNVLLDIAAGRGADIGRYNLGQFTQVVAIDGDSAALSELSRRKFSKHFKNLPQIFTAQIDMNAINNLEDHLGNIGMPMHFDAISCNFAIHYFTKINKLVDLIAGVLKSEGKFGFTCFDGARVNALLADKKLGESWTVIDEGFVKFRIQKMYMSDKLEQQGQIINVKQPFSTELYSENLVNVDYVIQQFEKKGIKLHERKKFSDFHADFAADNQREFAKMTPDDLFYTGLYEFVILRKI